MRKDHPGSRELSERPFIKRQIRGLGSYQSLASMKQPIATESHAVKVRQKANELASMSYLGHVHKVSAEGLR